MPAYLDAGVVLLDVGGGRGVADVHVGWKCGEGGAFD
jgi:hypothetical protein